MHSSAEDCEDDCDEGNQEQAAHLATTPLCDGGRYGLGIFCAPRHRGLLRQRDVVEESYSQLELWAVELLG